VVFFPSGFPTKILYTSLLSPIRVTRTAHLILFDLITRKILGDQYRSLSSSLLTRSFIHSPVTSSLLGPNILLSTLFSKHPQPTFLPQCTRTHTHIHTHTHTLCVCVCVCVHYGKTSLCFKL